MYIKFRVGNIYKDHYTHIGYEELMEGTWFVSRDGENWVDGVFKPVNNPNIKIVRDLYTGIRSIEDTEIYENDLVEYMDSYNKPQQYVIKWVEKAGQFNFTYHYPPGKITPLKVIGNSREYEGKN